MTMARRPLTTRSFASIVLALVLAVCSTVAAAGVFVDPRADFGTGLFRPLVRDEVHEKMARWNELDAAPTTVIVGSSRALRIPPSAFGDDAFNFAVSASGTQLPLTVFRWQSSQGPPPREMVVAVDVEQLQPSYQERWHVLVAHEWDEHVPHPPALEDRLRPLKGTLTESYLRDSWRVVRMQWEGYPPDLQTFGPRGELVGTDDRVAQRIGAESALEFVEHEIANGFVAARGNLGEPAGHQLDPLERLVEEAVAAGTTVRFVVTPYHPRMLQELRAATPFEEARGTAVAALTGLCRAGVHVHDYTELEAFGGVPEDFEDAQHYTDANGARLAASVVAGSGDRCAG